MTSAQQVDAPAAGRSPFTSVPKPDEPIWKQILAQPPGRGIIARQAKAVSPSFH